MDRTHMVVINVGEEACPADRGGQLTPFLHEEFPAAALLVQTVTRKTSEPLSSPPDQILSCPFHLKIQCLPMAICGQSIDKWVRGSSGFISLIFSRLTAAM